MKQKMQYIQTLKQTLKLNQKLLKSLDFLTDNIDDINKVVQQVLETNPFLYENHLKTMILSNLLKVFLINVL